MLRSDLYDAVSSIGDAGFDYIELWGEVPHAYHEWVDKNRLKDVLSSYDFGVTMHAPFTDLNPAANFEPVRGAVAKTLKDFVRFAVELEAVRVTFHPGGVHNGVLLRRSTEGVVTLLRELTKESSGVLVINVENQARSSPYYHFPIGGDPESLASLIANVEGVSCTLDTGHAHVNGNDPLRLFERLRDHVSEIHLSDNDGKCDDHLIPGQGTANLGGLLQQLAGTGVFVCFEVNPFKYSPEDVLEAAKEFRLRALS